MYKKNQSPKQENKNLKNDFHLQNKILNGLVDSFVSKFNVSNLCLNSPIMQSQLFPIYSQILHQKQVKRKLNLRQLIDIDYKLKRQFKNSHIHYQIAFQNAQKTCQKIKSIDTKQNKIFKEDNIQFLIWCVQYFNKIQNLEDAFKTICFQYNQAKSLVFFYEQNYIISQPAKNLLLNRKQLQNFIQIKNFNQFFIKNNDNLEKCCFFDSQDQNLRTNIEQIIQKKSKLYVINIIIRTSNYFVIKLSIKKTKQKKNQFLKILLVKQTQVKNVIELPQKKQILGNNFEKTHIFYKQTSLSEAFDFQIQNMILKQHLLKLSQEKSNNKQYFQKEFFSRYWLSYINDYRQDAKKNNQIMVQLIKTIKDDLELKLNLQLLIRLFYTLFKQQQITFQISVFQLFIKNSQCQIIDFIRKLNQKSLNFNCQIQDYAKNILILAQILQKTNFESLDVFCQELCTLFIKQDLKNQFSYKRISETFDNFCFSKLSFSHISCFQKAIKQQKQSQNEKLKIFQNQKTIKKEEEPKNWFNFEQEYQLHKQQFQDQDEYYSL